MPGIDTDEFMPELWPANKILGLILDDQLEGIEASKIVGLIVNDQVASLAAAKIEGKLTQAQIETIAAEQITGKLTNAQIAEIAAAKIVGQLTDAQLGGISAAKIIGELASGQISSLEALKITGQLSNSQIKELEAAKIKGELTNAQIKSLEAAKVTGQLSNAQLAGLASAKIEGLLTNAQIESLAVAKLVGQISESQIAAKAVTAGKINVAELSAISVNAGTIEAGIFKGVTFETAKGETTFDKEGLRLVAVAASEPENKRVIEWINAAKETIGKIFTTINPVSQVQLFINAEGKGVAESALLSLTARAKGKSTSGITITSEKTTGAGLVQAFVSGGINKVLVNQEEKSNFVQAAGELRKQILATGIIEFEFAGGSNFANAIIEVTHGIGSVPKVLFNVEGTNIGAQLPPNCFMPAAPTETKFKAQLWVNGQPAKGTKVKVHWTALS